MCTPNSHSMKRDNTPLLRAQNIHSPVINQSMEECQDNEQAIPVGFWVVLFAIIGMVIWVMIARTLVSWFFG